MNRIALLALLGAVALITLGVIGIEMIGPGPDEAEATPATEATKPVVAPPRPVVQPPKTGEWATVSLARPLFSVSRKPDNVKSSEPVNQEETAMALPRLSGIQVVGDSRRAIFQPLGDTPALVLAEGDALAAEGESLADWRVEKISLTEVTVTGPAGETVLEPKFDENSPPPPPPPPVLQRPAPPNAAQLRGGPVPGQPFNQPGQQPGQPVIRPNPAQNQAQQQRQAPGVPVAARNRFPVPRNAVPPNNGAPTPGVR